MASYASWARQRHFRHRIRGPHKAGAIEPDTQVSLPQGKIGIFWVGSIVPNDRSPMCAGRGEGYMGDRWRTIDTLKKVKIGKLRQFVAKRVPKGPVRQRGRKAPTALGGRRRSRRPTVGRLEAVEKTSELQDQFVKDQFVRISLSLPSRFFCIWFFLLTSSHARVGHRFLPCCAFRASS